MGRELSLPWKRIFFSEMLVNQGKKEKTSFENVMKMVIMIQIPSPISQV